MLFKVLFNRVVSCCIFLCWVKCSIAESTANYCSKGSVIGVKGRLMTSLYKNPEGNTCKNVEVVAEKVSFLGYPSKEKPNKNEE